MFVLNLTFFVNGQHSYSMQAEVICKEINLAKMHFYPDTGGKVDLAT